MRYSIAALALAGAVAAMPSKIVRQAVQEVDVVQTDVQVVVQTDVVTVGGGSEPSPAPAAPSPDNSPAPAPAAATTLVTVVTQAPAAPAAAAPAAGPPKAHNQVAAPAAAPSPASSPAAAASPSPAASSSSPSDPNSSPTADQMLAVANHWRTAYNLPTYTWNSTLADNAAKTGKDDGGSKEDHELNTISMAQVITPGSGSCQGFNCAGQSNSFELAYLAGWLCEKPQAALSDCSTLTTAGHLDLSSGETGHADILTSQAYKQIGCAFSPSTTPTQGSPWDGLWICDLC